MLDFPTSRRKKYSETPESSKFGPRTTLSREKIYIPKLPGHTPSEIVLSEELGRSSNSPTHIA